jgi:hypothetical protein
VELVGRSQHYRHCGDDGERGDHRRPHVLVATGVREREQQPRDRDGDDADPLDVRPDGLPR